MTDVNCPGSQEDLVSNWVFFCLTQSTIPSPLSKLKRRPDSLEATQWAPRDLHCDLRQDEALARDGVSREVPCSTLKGETVPDSLPAYSYILLLPGRER